MASRVVAASSAILAAGTVMALWACGDRSGPLDSTPQTDTGLTAERTYAKLYKSDKKHVRHEVATNPGWPWGDYIGSGACEACHKKEYADWRASLHSRTLYDAIGETVFGEFTGDKKYESKATATEKAFAYRIRPFRDAGRFFIQITRDPDPAAVEDPYGAGQPTFRIGTWEVIYAFGNRRHQPYVGRDKDGSYWVLPWYWNDIEKTWMVDGWRPYVQSCAHCHVTGIRTEMRKEGNGRELPMTEPEASRWAPPPSREGWAEGAVGCEICHGPGRPHAEKAQALGTDQYRGHMSDPGFTSLIYCPSRGTAEDRMSQCDSCHNFQSESTVTWVPGPNGYDHKMRREPITPESSSGQFWKDGTDMSPCTVGRVFRDSKMGKSGKVECKDCHDSHGNESFGSLVKPLAKNELCLTCHADKFGTTEQLIAHTHHKAGSVGSSCIECHMPRDKRFTNGVQVMSAQIPSHVISIPTGEKHEGGPDPSCNTCHTDRNALWTWNKIRELWAKPAAGK